MDPILLLIVIMNYIQHIMIKLINKVININMEVFVNVGYFWHHSSHPYNYLAMT